MDRNTLQSGKEPTFRARSNRPRRKNKLMNSLSRISAKRMPCREQVCLGISYHQDQLIEQIGILQRQNKKRVKAKSSYRQLNKQAGMRNRIFASIRRTFIKNKIQRPLIATRQPSRKCLVRLASLLLCSNVLLKSWLSQGRTAL